jgi:hypothetical protein
LILKSKIPLIGSKTDVKRRLNLTRVDCEEWQRDVEDARRLIFEKGINITSERVEKILRPESLVPTRVCYLLYHY